MREHLKGFVDSQLQALAHIAAVTKTNWDDHALAGFQAAWESAVLQGWILDLLERAVGAGDVQAVQADLTHERLPLAVQELNLDWDKVLDWVSWLLQVVRTFAR